jgi:hypothetical protein
MTNQNNSTSPAFPHLEVDLMERPLQLHPGLTKREYFAGIAMQGYCANYHCWQEKTADQVAALSLQYADALLKELSNEQ